MPVSLLRWLSIDGLAARAGNAAGWVWLTYAVPGAAGVVPALYIASDVWQHVGWGSIIYLAALTNIDPQLHEAAAIDGAGRWRRLWHVTWPGILPTVAILFILALGRIMEACCCGRCVDGTAIRCRRVSLDAVIGEGPHAQTTEANWHHDSADLIATLKERQPAGTP